MAVNKKNYNKNIKVSESVVAELRKGTKASNIAKANRVDASPQFKEAVRRFYGKEATGTTRPTGKITPKSRGSVASKASSKPATKSKAGMGMRGKASDKKTLGNIAGVGDSSASGTSFGNQMKAGKNYKAPKSYKPLSTGAKLSMAASAVPAGRAAIAGGKAAYKAAVIAKNTRTLKTATGSRAALAQAKIGAAKGLATKKEVQQIKAAVSKKRGKK